MWVGKFRVMGGKTVTAKQKLGKSVRSPTIARSDGNGKKQKQKAIAKCRVSPLRRQSARPPVEMTVFE
jgi:hypothetical protein